jgi:hypothetical protein
MSRFRNPELVAGRSVLSACLSKLPAVVLIDLGTLRDSRSPRVVSLHRRRVQVDGNAPQHLGTMWVCHKGSPLIYSARMDVCHYISTSLQRKQDMRLLPVACWSLSTPLGAVFRYYAVCRA